jgi:hypothetical protein
MNGQRPRYFWKIVFGIILLAAALFLAAFTVPAIYQNRLIRRSSDCSFVRRVLESYIRSNQGHFPGSADDLEQKGFLRKIQDSGKIKYQAWDSHNWRDIEFEKYIILYDAQPERYYVKNEMLHNERIKVLIDKKTQQPILLLDTIERNEEEFEDLIYGLHYDSVELYKAMIEAQGQEGKAGP